ncbi:NAD(P)-binding protein [Linderina pennispora]|uniref:NAD(P)-binding protein n=1 Tax=Linderina pennispora TaxID=61395 RepID=A0A1Y1WB38_9FUNG|nr:NAD(P)-binding protein [Linderina pennispora]ORX70538.1 NAD(P)-binding protein [Linderina pennispora]
MSSPIKSVALVGGTGTTGAFFIDEFKKNGQDFNVTLITRKESEDSTKAKFADTPHFTIRGVDYDDEADLATALTGQDAVLSILGLGSIGKQQLALVKAAAKAGVKYFIPSEFGSDFGVAAGESDIIFKPKEAVRQTIEESGLKHIYIITGLFSDFFVNSYYCWDLENFSVEIPGDGSQKSAFTSRADIAKFTVAILKRADEFADKTVRIAGYHLSFNDWVNQIEAAAGKKLTVTYSSIEDIEAKVAADIKVTGGWHSLGDQLRLIVAKDLGRLDLGGNTLDNDKFPSLDFAPLEEYVRDIVNKSQLSA